MCTANQNFVRTRDVLCLVSRPYHAQPPLLEFPSALQRLVGLPCCLCIAVPTPANVAANTAKLGICAGIYLFSCLYFLTLYARTSNVLRLVSWRYHARQLAQTCHSPQSIIIAERWPIARGVQLCSATEMTDAPYSGVSQAHQWDEVDKDSS